MYNKDIVMEVTRMSETMNDKFCDCPRINNLGIIYKEESGRGLTHPFFSLILNAFKNEAEKQGFDITFINPHDAEKEDGYLGRVNRSRLDGVCMVCVDFEAPWIRSLIESGIPCVTVDHIFRRIPAVLSDNETGVQKLVEYAISLGHRRIAFIHGHNNSVVTRTRIKQFYNVMNYYDLPIPEEYLCEGLYDDIVLTRKLTGKLLRLTEPPTCILLPDDISYLGAQDAAHEMGLRIPEDISFAGYDCIPMAQALSPKLTTIRQSCEQMGSTAAQKLIGLIVNPEKTKSAPVIFPVELVKGGTVADLR